MIVQTTVSILLKEPQGLGKMWERRGEELADKLCCCSSVFGGASANLITFLRTFFLIKATFFSRTVTT